MGAGTVLGAESIKLWRGEVVSGAGASAPPGTVVAVRPDAIEVATGQGVLRLLELQRAGGKRLAAPEFLRGMPLEPGVRLGAATP